MTCGDIAWWREPDFIGLLQRHGEVEHLVVQFDFLSQVQRDGRAEYSIPGASKSRSGNTGYADIVSIATGEIWEIKPKYLKSEDGETLAFKEAGWYAQNANASCGNKWRRGTSFTISEFATTEYGGGGVIYRVEGSGNKAELVAEQGRAGTVLYFWRINNKVGEKVDSLYRRYAYYLRQQVITDYFTAGQPPQPLSGSKPPDNFPPVKFKPPVLRPDACIPQLGKVIPTLIKSIHTTCAQTVVENSSVAVLLEARIFNALVGPSLVANRISMLQVKGADPTVTLYREALTVLTGVAAAHGVVGLVIGLATVLYLIIDFVIVAGPAAAPVIIVGCEATSLPAVPTLVAGGL